MILFVAHYKLGKTFHYYKTEKSAMCGVFYCRRRGFTRKKEDAV